MSAVGDIIVIGEQSLPDTVRYAGASGDFNPLHYDPAAAARAGFARVLVHGGWLAARIERALASYATPRALVVRFERPVMIGEALSLSWHRGTGTIDAALTVGEEKRVTATLSEASAAVAEPVGIDVLDEPYEWPVEQGALRDFLAATGEPRPVTGVPLAFLGNAARWTRSSTSIVRRLGFAYDRLLHGGSSFQLIGEPIRLGEVLLVTEAHANREARPHRSGGAMQLADTLHQIADRDGRLRARMINRFIERPARTA